MLPLLSCLFDHFAQAPAERSWPTVDREWVSRVLTELRLEVLPTFDQEALARVVPPTATLTVTSSPSHSLAATVMTALALHRYGYRVVPHLAARALRSVAELRTFWQELATAGIDEAFVIGGD